MDCNLRAAWKSDRQTFDLKNAISQWSHWLTSTASAACVPSWSDCSFRKTSNLSCPWSNIILVSSCIRDTSSTASLTSASLSSMIFSNWLSLWALMLRSHFLAYFFPKWLHLSRFANRVQPSSSSSSSSDCFILASLCRPALCTPHDSCSAK